MSHQAQHRHQLKHQQHQKQFKEILHFQVMLFLTQLTQILIALRVNNLMIVITLILSTPQQMY
jgi:hypothetical protein